MAFNSADLVSYVEAHPGAAPADLAQHFSVSDRTIRAYVRCANDALDGCATIILERRCGYALTINDDVRYQRWLARTASTLVCQVPSTPADRVRYLLNDLLMRNDWITLDDLSSILFISRSAISHNLKQVEKTLSNFGMRLERRPHYGIRVKGTEMQRRLCLANVAVDSMDDARAEGGASGHAVVRTVEHLLDAGIGRNVAIDAIAACVERVTVAEGFAINMMAYQNLLVHIAVALLRIEDGCYVPMDQQRLESIREGKEYVVAAKIAREITSETGIELSAEEVAYIAIHLAGKQTIFDVSDESEGVVVSEEVWDLVSRMLELVWQTFRFDFRQDLELRMNLGRHIMPLSVRLKYHMTLENPMLEDIKHRYPLGYSMAADSSAILSEHYGSSLSEDEIAYIALAFTLALERKKAAPAKKNILMVCASGTGSARLLEYRYLREFGDYIDTITTCDVLHVSQVDFSNIDYVFTTVPIDRSLPVPVREVRFFLDDAEEIEGVRAFLRGGRDSLSRGMLSYFDPRLFFDHLTACSKAEALDQLLDSACAIKRVAPDFRELVWEREALVPTSFGNMVAMPHPMAVATEESFVCVGILDEPVVWDDLGHEVQVVFLAAFACGADADQHVFLDVFSRLLVSSEGIERLCAERTFQTLAGLLAWSAAQRANPDGTTPS